MRSPTYMPHTATLQTITGYGGTTGTQPIFGNDTTIQCRIARGKFSNYSADGTLIKFDASMQTRGNVNIKTNDRVIFDSTTFNVVNVETTITKTGKQILKYITLSK
jgi:hypothetical protein